MRENLYQYYLIDRGHHRYRTDCGEGLADTFAAEDWMRADVSPVAVF